MLEMSKRTGAIRILIRQTRDIQPSEITEERIYQRRDFIRLAGDATLAAAAALLPTPEATTRLEAAEAASQSPLQAVRPNVVSTDERWNSFEEITSYNNFYEFGPGRKDPQRYAGGLKVSPWTVTIDGLCDAPATYHLDDVIRPHQLEERIYRHRCVEAWSMVIPWIGIPLSAVLRRVRPQAGATFVEFTTLHRPSEMPGQKQPILEWPYGSAHCPAVRCPFGCALKEGHHGYRDCFRSSPA
jgi:sulfoxide reductase catalytic subunit YedY